MPGRRTEQLAAWLLGLHAANNVDAVATLAGVLAGVFDEANPIMAGALAGGPVAFLAAKLALVSLASVLLWQLRWDPRALPVAKWSTAVLGAVSLSHAAWVLPLLF